MRDNGFLKLSRKFFTNEFWMEARTYSACEAWLDLVQSARFDASPRTESIGGRDITWERGQYPASVRFLAKRWQWSERSVRSFLDRLKKRRMITCDSSQGQNIITLCKYDDYNTINDVGGTPKDTPGDTDMVLKISELTELVTQLSTQLLTQGRHSGDTKLKKDKKDNKEDNKEISSNEDTKKEAGASSPSPEYLKFTVWMEKHAPYCSNPKNFKQITEEELIKLKKKYTGLQVSEIIEQIENRKDLRKRYSNLYRTVLNWAKKEYGD